MLTNIGPNPREEKSVSLCRNCGQPGHRKDVRSQHFSSFLSSDFLRIARMKRLCSAVIVTFGDILAENARSRRIGLDLSAACARRY